MFPYGPFACTVRPQSSARQAPCAGSQLCLPPTLALAAAVAEAHAAANADTPGTSYPRLDDLGQNMRYTAALLWASGEALGCGGDDQKPFCCSSS